MNGLVQRIRGDLAGASDPKRAAQQQAYMKSSMPYRGVTVPQVRALTKSALRDEPVVDQSDLVEIVSALWNGAQYREEWYAALTVLQVPKHRLWRDVSLLPLYEHLVVTGRWWDVVDDLSTHALRELLIAHPAPVRPLMRSWAQDDDLWRRRAALVCQVGAKGHTDPGLLSEVITSALKPPDAISSHFFVRKGIGWALRDYARVDPRWVRGFVDEHRSELSPLSIREATKHLGSARATGK